MAQDEGEAVRWFRRAADQGDDATAQFALGVMHSAGRGVRQDEGEAVRWFRRAADQGHADAQYAIGLIYDPDSAEADAQAFEQGDQVTFDQFTTVVQDEGEAARWFRRAADQGHTEAQFALFGMYSEGRGVAQDKGEAARWFRRAIGQGVPPRGDEEQ